MDTQVDLRFQRAWSFFQQNAPDLLLGGLVAIVGWAVVLPGPWFTLNLLAEITDCLRSGNKVRWQAAFNRPGLFLKSWVLLITMVVAISAAFVACLAPGAALMVAWMHAPARVADGEPVFDALEKSFRSVTHGFTAGVLNSLVLLAMAGLTIATGVVALLTLPLGLTYLALCYLDDAAGVLPAATPSDLQVAAS